MPDEFDPVAILRALEEHGVRYVIVGGFAAWMQGVPVVTTDVDIVYEASVDNVAALVRALRALSARYRHQMGRHVEPDESMLGSTTSAGHHLLETEAGDLDVLRTAGGEDFSTLTDVITLEIDDLRVRLASLPRLIAMKEAAGRPKDLAALPLLRAALEVVDDDE